MGGAAGDGVLGRTIHINRSRTHAYKHAHMHINRLAPIMQVLPELGSGVSGEGGAYLLAFLLSTIGLLLLSDSTVDFLWTVPGLTAFIWRTVGWVTVGWVTVGWVTVGWVTVGWVTVGCVMVGCVMVGCVMVGCVA